MFYTNMVDMEYEAIIRNLLGYSIFLVSIIKLLTNEMRLGGTYNCTKGVLDMYWREKVWALLKHLSSKS
jgi:hypothetical protein